VIRSRERLVHAKVLVLIVAIFEATALVFHGLVVVGNINMSFRTGGYRFLYLWFLVIVLSRSLLRLLLAFVFGLLLVV
jgi:hypothetical protein